jgi:predicted secreted protein
MRTAWVIVAIFVIIVWVAAWLSLRTSVEDNTRDIGDVRDDVKSLERKMERLDTTVWSIIRENDRQSHILDKWMPPVERGVTAK